MTTTEPPNGNGWTSWSRYVLTELERNHTEHANMMKLLNQIQIGQAELKVKASLWGGLAGCIPAAIGIIWALTR